MVDGLKKEYEGRADVLRADMMSGPGRALAKRYKIDTVPGFVVLDKKGRGIAETAKLRAASTPQSSLIL